MMKFLVGIDGTPRGKRALEWAAFQAQHSCGELVLISILDVTTLKAFGLHYKDIEEGAEMAQAFAKNLVAEKYPSVPVESLIVEGSVIDKLVENADKCDCVVLGSHHGFGADQAFGNSTGLKVSVSTKVPTVVVPYDWRPENAGKGITVGVGPDASSDAAVNYGITKAMLNGEVLKFVSGWGLPAFLTKPAEAMGGGIGPVGEQFQRNLDNLVARVREMYPTVEVSGEAVESVSPARAILEASKHSNMLVLGTHSYGTFGRALFGSTTHNVLSHLIVPTVIVPVK